MFLQICDEIKFPVALEKTYWASTSLVFLGLLIDTVKQLVLLPKEKILAGRDMISQVLHKANRKVTIHELQRICGFLNFLGRAIVPGRAFTRCLYVYTKSNTLKPHHHVRINKEMRRDLEMWSLFLMDPTVFSRPFLDFNKSLTAIELKMFSDAAKSPELGYRAICNKSWMYGMILFITYLEILHSLFALIKTSNNTNADINLNKRIKCNVPLLSKQKVVKLFL